MEIRDDEHYMRRAIRLARNGYGHVSPNPAVGCVIVGADGTIVGEGWHRVYGEGHAEVNAVAAVTSPRHLEGATVYVTLEPCSHYGKTPPCAGMLASLPVKRVVAGMQDPNPKVQGRGLEMLRQAGKEVVAGVLEDECRALNPAFLTAHRLHRPFITLKWACGADGMMGSTDGRRLFFSNAVSEMWMHRERTLHDAIMVGRRTAIADNPSLTSRRWPGRQPMPVVTGGKGFPEASLMLAANPDTLWLPRRDDLAVMAEELFSEHGITSLLVEGGARLINAFIATGLYDRIRRETAPGVNGGDIPAPRIPSGLVAVEKIEVQENVVETWVRKELFLPDSTLKKA